MKYRLIKCFLTKPSSLLFTQLGGRIITLIPCHVAATSLPLLLEETDVSQVLIPRVQRSLLKATSLPIKKSFLHPVNQTIPILI